MDSKIDNDDSDSKSLEQFIPSEDPTSYNLIEDYDLHIKLNEFYKTLTPLELKVLKLKGFELWAL